MSLRVTVAAVWWSLLVVACGSDGSSSASDVADTAEGVDTVVADSESGADGATDTSESVDTVDPCDAVSPGACAGQDDTATLCEGAMAVTCGRDGDGCLVEAERDDCSAQGMACDAGACIVRPGDACTTAFPVDGTYTVSGDDASADFSDRASGGEGCADLGPEAFFAVPVGPTQIVRAASVGSEEAMIQLRESCDVTTCKASFSPGLTWFAGVDTTLHFSAELTPDAPYDLSVQVYDAANVGAVSPGATPPSFAVSTPLSAGQAAIFVFEVVERTQRITVSATSDDGFPELLVAGPGNLAFASERLGLVRGVFEPGYYLILVSALPELGDVDGFEVDFDATPVPVCGDGLVEGDEACDAGEDNGTGGCSTACEPDLGYTCAGEPSTCTPPGNLGTLTPGGSVVTGLTPSLAPGEVAMFRFTVTEPVYVTGEALSVTSQAGLLIRDAVTGRSVAFGFDQLQSTAFGPGDYVLSLFPPVGGDEGAIFGISCQISAFARPCGNGATNGDEQCDDGDALAGDGCDGFCAVEPGWACSGTPSACTGPTPTGMSTIGDTYTATEDQPLEAGERRYYAFTTTQRTALTATASGAAGEYALRAIDVARPSRLYYLSDLQGGTVPTTGPLPSGDYVVEVVAPGGGSGLELALELIAPFGCGDGRIGPEEACDDGNDVSGDGCSGDNGYPIPCRREPGYDCLAEGEPCEAWSDLGYLHKGASVAVSDADLELALHEAKSYLVEAVEAPLVFTVGFESEGFRLRIHDLTTGEAAAFQADGDVGVLSTVGRYRVEAYAVANDVTELSFTLEVSTEGVCGDGQIDEGEECDDGFLPGEPAAGDGCDRDCQAEVGWTCEVDPPGCTPPESFGPLAVGTPVDLTYAGELAFLDTVAFIFRVDEPVRLVGNLSTSSGHVAMGYGEPDALGVGVTVRTKAGGDFALPILPGHYVMLVVGDEVEESAPGFELHAQAEALPCGDVTYQGCCYDDGSDSLDQPIVLYCEDGALQGASCDACGWDGVNAFYNCSGVTSSEDPSGTHPRQCPDVP